MTSVTCQSRGVTPWVVRRRDVVCIVIAGVIALLNVTLENEFVVGVTSMALLALAIGVVGYSWWWLRS